MTLALIRRWPGTETAPPSSEDAPSSSRCNIARLVGSAWLGLGLGFRARARVRVRVRARARVRVRVRVSSSTRMLTLALVLPKAFLARTTYSVRRCAASGLPVITPVAGSSARPGGRSGTTP